MAPVAQGAFSTVRHSSKAGRGLQPIRQTLTQAIDGGNVLRANPIGFSDAAKVGFLSAISWVWPNMAR